MTHIELIFIQRVKSVSRFIFFFPGGFQVVPVASKCDILSKGDYKFRFTVERTVFLFVFTCFAKSVKETVEKWTWKTKM